MISEEGFFSYLFTSIRSFNIGILSYEDYWHRLGFLYYLTDEVRLKEYIELILDFSIDHWRDYFNEVDLYQCKEVEKKTRDLDLDILSKIEIPQNITKDDDNLIYFKTTKCGILGKKWTFHQADIDFFPSVPHGHLLERDYIKLDAYLGDIYDTKSKKKLSKREKRIFIIELWNDKTFRKRALETIKIVDPRCITRVNNPLKLPRIRNVKFL